MDVAKLNNSKFQAKEKNNFFANFVRSKAVTSVQNRIHSERCAAMIGWQQHLNCKLDWNMSNFCAAAHAPPEIKWKKKNEHIYLIRAHFLELFLLSPFFLLHHHKKPSNYSLLCLCRIYIFFPRSYCWCSFPCIAH